MALYCCMANAPAQHESLFPDPGTDFHKTPHSKIMQKKTRMSFYAEQDKVTSVQRTRQDA